MIRFTLNGTQIEIEDGENRTLLEYLRNVKCMKIIRFRKPNLLSS